MENKKAVSQEQFKEYSLPPINGTEFVGSLSNRIQFEIPSTHFLKGRENFRLNFKVLNTSATKQRLGVSPTAGANSLINRIDLYNLSGELLESLHNYNQICAVINQYNFNDANNINALEGVSVNNVARVFEGDAVNNVSVRNSKSVNNPEDLILSPIDKTTGEAKYNPVIFSLDVKAGLLSAFDNDEKLLPLPYLNGLRIVVYLEDPKIALVNISGASGENLVVDGVACLPNANVSDHVFIQGEGDYQLDPIAPGSQNVEITDTSVNVTNVKYKVGDLVSIYGIMNALPANIPAKIASFGSNVGKLVLNLTKPDGTPIGGEFTHQVDPANVRFTNSNVTVENCGFTIGNVCDIVSSTNPVPANYPAQNKKITSIAYDNTEKRIKVTFSPNDVPAGGTDLKLKLSAVDKSYRVEPTLNFMSIMPTSQPSVKNFKYQFTTYDFFINTIPSASRNFQIEIPSVATMAKAIFTTYANGNKLDDNENSQLFVGDFPEESNIDSIQYYIDNRYQPVRPYNPQVTVDKVINQHELQKALTVINRLPESMGDNSGANLNGYTNQYLHALRLAKDPYIYDLSQAEPQIRLGFSATRTFNMNAYTFVFSNKIINVDNSGVSVLQ